MANWKDIFLIFMFHTFPTTHSFDCNGNNLAKLKVHLVPHSHEDTGWVNTVKEYYDLKVRDIIYSIITNLQKDPKRTFIYVEMAFFTRWWSEQSASMRSAVKKLVKNKQLEFTNGGWCMNDEATTYYNAIIDQMTLGLRFINNTFGSGGRPTIAWQIDPFGHSAEQASLFSLMSFDALFLGRIHFKDKIYRKRHRQLEMIWRGSRNYGPATEIFTGVLFNRYSAPDGFCFDDACEDSASYLGGKKQRPQVYVDRFVDTACHQAKSYKTSNILMTMGDDFMYERAGTWYTGMDELIENVNKDGRIEVSYSSPSRYLKALSEANEKWSIKSDDFFPYAIKRSTIPGYWTGYFTSRPTLKRYIRESNNILQACKQSEVMWKNIGAKSSTSLREAMALNQHHDAITGTEKQFVAEDYKHRLHMGRVECQEIISGLVKSKLVEESASQLSEPEIKFHSCDHLNISVCNITEKEKSIIINVYNPLARDVFNYIRFPILSVNVAVMSPTGKYITSQIIPITSQLNNLRKTVKGIVQPSDFIGIEETDNERTDELAKHEITFKVHAPPLGFSTYAFHPSVDKKYIATMSNRSKTEGVEDEIDQHGEEMGDGNNVDRVLRKKVKHQVKINNKDIIIENGKVKLKISKDSGRLTQISRNDKNLTVDIDQQFYWYKAKDFPEPSGAYIFNPLNDIPKEISSAKTVIVDVIKGPVVQEIHQKFTSFLTQVIRLYNDSPYVELEYTVGPIPVDDGVGKEIISRFDTDIRSKGVFYTDANGREMKLRKRISKQPARNYYPVTSRIFINDSDVQLTVMTDRSQGGSSMKDGQVELMLHRRLLQDDNLGVDEPLYEKGINGVGVITRGKHRLFVTDREEGNYLHRVNGVKMMSGTILSFSKAPLEVKNVVRTYTALTVPLPENVHLLTLQTGRKDQVIIRLEHIFEKDEHPTLSFSALITLPSLFKDFDLMSIKETNLSANQFLEDKKKMKWNITSEEDDDIYHVSASKPIEHGSIVLDPMQIRTFLANIKYK